MRNTILGLAGVVGLAMIANVSFARPGLFFDYDKMTSDADLVVIATPLATKELEEETVLLGHVDVVGLETRFEVSVRFKGKLRAKDKSTVVLHHYRFKNPPPADRLVPNALTLLQFEPDGRCQYLMFLRRMPDGRYEPFCGQADIGGSIEKLRKQVPRN